MGIFYHNVPLQYTFMLHKSMSCFQRTTLVCIYLSCRVLTILGSDTHLSTLCKFTFIFPCKRGYERNTPLYFINVTMSVTLQKYVSMLFKRNIPQHFVDTVYIRNNTLLRAPKIHFLHYKINRPCLEYFRATSTNVRSMYSAIEPTFLSNKDESRELMAIWPDVVRDLTDAGRHLDIPDVTKWLAKVLQYNVPVGRKNRALSVVYAFKSFASYDQQTEENIRLSRILGWCIELLQAFLLVIDDIQDQSTIRRNAPCWYLNNGIGLAAINDGIMLEMCIYQLLKKHFKSKECYLSLMELFLDTTLRTSMGQCLDLLSTNFGKKSNLNLFTMDRYNSIAKYKTAYYTFVLPTTTAMCFAGIKDPEMYRQAKTILLEMGHFFQVQDDYMNCYGSMEATGKTGSDIEAGKCSWLVVVALQRATSEQRKILEECYGQSDVKKLDRVKQLYDELGLPNTYAIYEEETYNLLMTHIQQISRGLPHDFFLKLLERACRRVARKD
ncbi:farnesyl pyrophosphate synthase isoform X2 [Megachile rotundata]|uniref:farnesyl pyrophosphate synthase isoform X2 n=1 Tax=Megachile rotundata TaxID=143995 RepID=UPI00061541CF|nr:PREDICTED: farnesyl pyrophosphate synthase isoform X2 [Megachile rotundata]